MLSEISPLHTTADDGSSQLGELPDAACLTDGHMADVSQCNISGPHRAAILVSFIIPALNEEQYVGCCLQSIQRLDLPAGVGGVEVIVVDNRSRDQTAKISRDHGAIVQDIAPGRPSRARNAGVSGAKGDWLAFVDADCELDKNWLVVCSSHLANDANVMAVGATTRAPASAAPWVERVWYELGHRPCGKEVTQVRWLPTFNLLVRKAAFLTAGGFDERLTTCEDCDLGYRLAELGSLILDSRTRVAHLGESHSLRELFRREAWRTRGNLRLALSRPFDWSNWLSLLFPPGLLGACMLAMGGTAIAALIKQPVWPWLTATAVLWLTIALFVVEEIGLKQCIVCRQSRSWSS